MVFRLGNVKRTHLVLFVLSILFVLSLCASCVEGFNLNNDEHTVFKFKYTGSLTKSNKRAYFEINYGGNWFWSGYEGQHQIMNTDVESSKITIAESGNTIHTWKLERLENGSFRATINDKEILNINLNYTTVKAAKGTQYVTSNFKENYFSGDGLQYVQDSFKQSGGTSGSAGAGAAGTGAAGTGAAKGETPAVPPEEGAADAAADADAAAAAQTKLDEANAAKAEAEKTGAEKAAADAIKAATAAADAAVNAVKEEEGVDLTAAVEAAAAQAVPPAGDTPAGAGEGTPPEGAQLPVRDLTCSFVKDEQGKYVLTNKSIFVFNKLHYFRKVINKDTGKEVSPDNVYVRCNNFSTDFLPYHLQAREGEAQQLSRRAGLRDLRQNTMSYIDELYSDPLPHDRRAGRWTHENNMWDAFSTTASGGETIGLDGNSKTVIQHHCPVGQYREKCKYNAQGPIAANEFGWGM